MENSPLPFADSSPSGLANIRLVATDMDGTLTDHGQFTPMLLQCLEDLATAGLPILVVTGRSAGWVQSLVAYLPIAGAIAENGGVFVPKTTWEPAILGNLPAIAEHRSHLATMFAQIQHTFPRLRPAADNAFRITDWTFDIHDLTPADLATIQQICAAAGWGFTYSTVQCHIRPARQDKGLALRHILPLHFPAIDLSQVITVGDSPNDESLFDPALFPLSVGVANVGHYCDRLRHRPAFITREAEVRGFQEIVRRLLAPR